MTRRALGPAPLGLGASCCITCFHENRKCDEKRRKNARISTGPTHKVLIKANGGRGASVGAGGRRPLLPPTTRETRCARASKAGYVNTGCEEILSKPAARTSPRQTLIGYKSSLDRYASSLPIPSAVWSIYVQKSSPP